MGLMHIVLVRAKPTASPAALATMVSEIQGMASKMPGLVTRITVGDSVLDDGAADRRKGFTHGFTVELKDRQSLSAYIEHPEHERVRDTHIRPNTEDLLAFDYEI